MTRQVPQPLPRKQPEQLVDPSTKRTIDITGKSAAERGVPTGPGLLVRAVGKGNGAQARLLALDRWSPHTENLGQFSVTDITTIRTIGGIHVSAHLALTF